MIWWVRFLVNKRSQSSMTIASWNTRWIYREFHRRKLIIRLKKVIHLKKVIRLKKKIVKFTIGFLVHQNSLLVRERIVLPTSRWEFHKMKLSLKELIRLKKVIRLKKMIICRKKMIIHLYKIILWIIQWIKVLWELMQAK